MQEPLVLIPGMMCDGRLFAPQLAKFTLERPVLVIPPVGESTMTGLARRMLDIAPDRFALAGLSMGGDCCHGNHTSGTGAGYQTGVARYQPAG